VENEDADTRVSLWITSGRGGDGPVGLLGESISREETVSDGVDKVARVRDGTASELLSSWLTGTHAFVFESSSTSWNRAKISQVAWTSRKSYFIRSAQH
jgi:hypothetical protein